MKAVIRRSHKMIKIKTIDPNKINQNYKIKDINIELPDRGFVVFLL